MVVASSRWQAANPCRDHERRVLAGTLFFAATGALVIVLTAIDGDDTRLDDFGFLLGGALVAFATAAAGTWDATRRSGG